MNKYLLILLVAVVAVAAVWYFGFRSPDAETVKNYVGYSADECSRIQVSCIPGYERFDDESGCGCQPADQENVSPPPTSGASGKIDIGEVCRGALAYMTFPDGAAADVFVQDCIDGKYPEVIEKFKRDTGISDDAAI